MYHSASSYPARTHRYVCAGYAETIDAFQHRSVYCAIVGVHLTNVIFPVYPPYNDRRYTGPPYCPYIVLGLCLVCAGAATACMHLLGVGSISSVRMPIVPDKNGKSQEYRPTSPRCTDPPCHPTRIAGTPAHGMIIHTPVRCQQRHTSTCTCSHDH
jgi:hypothetical protein